MRPIDIGAPGARLHFQLLRKRDVLLYTMPFLITSIPFIAFWSKLFRMYSNYTAPLKIQDLIFPKAYLISILIAACISVLFGIFSFFKFIKAFSDVKKSQDLSVRWPHENNGRKWTQISLVSIFVGAIFVLGSALALNNVTFGKGIILNFGILIVLASLLVVVWLGVKVSRAIHEDRKSGGNTKNFVADSTITEIDRTLNPVFMTNLVHSTQSCFFSIEHSAKSEDSAPYAFHLPLDGISIIPANSGNMASVSLIQDGVAYQLQLNIFMRELDLNARIINVGGRLQIPVFNGDVFISENGKRGYVATREDIILCDNLKDNRECNIEYMRSMAIKAERSYLNVQSGETFSTKDVGRPGAILDSLGASVPGSNHQFE